MGRSAATRPGAVVIITNESRTRFIVQIKDAFHPDPDGWWGKLSFFGGSLRSYGDVDPVHEDPKDGLLRELREEIRNGDFVDILQSKLRLWRCFTLPYGEHEFELAVFEAVVGDTTFGALISIIHAGGIVTEGFPVTLMREQMAENFEIFGASLEVVAGTYLEEYAN